MSFYLIDLREKIINLRISAIDLNFKRDSKVRTELLQADNLLFKIIYNKYDLRTEKAYLNKINGIVYNSEKLLKG